MKNLKYILWSQLVAICIISCDVVDQNPVSELSQANFWQDEQDARAGLIATYDALQGALSSNYIHWGDSRTDAFNFETRGGGAPDLLMSNTLNPDLGQANWTALYRVISRANFVLDNVPNIADMSQESRDQVMGEALFLRAIAYFYLVRLWGDVPLITSSYTSANQEFNVTRTAAGEVFAQIMNDINAASSKLSVDTGEKGQATLGAVKALEAHVHAWKHEYAAAVDAIDEVMTMGYSLVSTNNFPSIFEQENTSESIFELQYSSANQELNAVANLFLVSPFKAGLYADLPPSEKILQLYSEGDIRYQTYFDVSSTTDIIYIRKYFGNPDVGVLNESDDNLILFRLAGMILLKAEMLNELGQTDDAVMLVNQIRARAGVTDATATNQSDARQLIQDERFRELFAEGQRWFDLVRNGMAVEEIETLTSTEAILWPISTSSIDRNSNLTQNPYYTN